MLNAIVLNIEKIYVPVKLRKEIIPQRVNAVAEEILEGAEERPIQVRRGKDRYVLLKGIHRLEARKALGEQSIQAFIVGESIVGMVN